MCKKTEKIQQVLQMADNLNMDYYELDRLISELEDLRGTKDPNIEEDPIQEVIRDNCAGLPNPFIPQAA